MPGYSDQVVCIPVSAHGPCSTLGCMWRRPGVGAGGASASLHSCLILSLIYTINSAQCIYYLAFTLFLQNLHFIVY